MESNDLKNLLTILTEGLGKNDFGNDESKIRYLCTELEKTKSKLPTTQKLEELQKIIIDLEVKYEELNEISYYFDPFYVKIKNTIHKEEVKKIREGNRRKKGID